MVVMSMEDFEKMQFESDIYFKLAEAERLANVFPQRIFSVQWKPRREENDVHAWVFTDARRDMVGVLDTLVI